MYYRFILSNNGNVATIGKYRYHSRFFVRVGHETTYRTRAIISRGLYIFYPIFHCGLHSKVAYITDSLCTKEW